MKKELLFRDLFTKAWKSFVDNFSQWMLLYATQLSVAIGFLICSIATLALVHYLFVDMCLFHCFFKSSTKAFVVSMISIVSIFGMFFIVVFPIMYKQNALDAVFGRTMSGFDVSNRFFSYAIAMFFYWMIITCATGLLVFPGLFLAQRWRFAGLYILDHGGNVKEGFRSSWKMTRGYMWFLIGLSMIQWMLFVFCGSTIVFTIIALSVNRLVDANVYKILHMEYDKNLSVCACEA